MSSKKNNIGKFRDLYSPLSCIDHAELTNYSEFLRLEESLKIRHPSPQWHAQFNPVFRWSCCSLCNSLMDLNWKVKNFRLSVQFSLDWVFEKELGDYRRVIRFFLVFPGGSAVKNPPAMQERWVWSLGQKDPLEKEMATHSGILAWEIPRTEKPGGL